MVSKCNHFSICLKFKGEEEAELHSVQVFLATGVMAEITDRYSKEP